MPTQKSRPAGGRARAPASRETQSYSSVHSASNPRLAAPFDPDVELPIAGRLGPGTVISCAVEAELWPEWTDAVAFTAGTGRGRA